MTAPKVFVTGATGFVGRAVIARLLADGRAVTALLLPNERATLPAEVVLARGDITRPDSLRGALAGCDAVIHLAGAVGYGQRMQVCRRVNVDGTENVAREAVRAGVRRFVHMSSVSVYGRVPDVPIDERSPLRAIGDPYGDTKIEAERVLAAVARDSRLETAIVRPTVIYGPGDDKFLPKLVQAMRTGRARIVGRGDNRVDLVHVDDVAAFLSQLVDDPRAAGGVYNLSNPDNGTWRELVDVVAHALDVPPPRRRVPYRLALASAGLLELAARVRGREPPITRYAVRVIGRHYDYRVDRARALGFAPGVSLHDGLRACLRSYAS